MVHRHTGTVITVNYSLAYMNCCNLVLTRLDCIVGAVTIARQHSDGTAARVESLQPPTAALHRHRAGGALRHKGRQHVSDALRRQRDVQERD